MARAVDDLGFVETVDGLGESIVVAVADAAYKPASAERSVYLIETYWADSSGRRNTLTGVAMNIRKRRSDRSGRVRLFSPGRPVAGRDERRRFWAAIAAGTAGE